MERRTKSTESRPLDASEWQVLAIYYETISETSLTTTVPTSSMMRVRISYGYRENIETHVEHSKIVDGHHSALKRTSHPNAFVVSWTPNTGTKTVSSSVGDRNRLVH